MIIKYVLINKDLYYVFLMTDKNIELSVIDLKFNFKFLYLLSYNVYEGFFDSNI